jgi:hypothetical protein
MMFHDRTCESLHFVWLEQIEERGNWDDRAIEIWLISDL